MYEDFSKGAELAFGEPTHINLELLFNDLFLLRNRFKELGMTIKDGEIYLADLENKDNA